MLVDKPLDCEQSLIFLCKVKLLHAKPKHRSGDSVINIVVCSHAG